MSNRTLIEINHDYGHAIARNQSTVCDLVGDLIRGGADAQVMAQLERFGIRVFGTRHHSDDFTIEWGGSKVAEPKS